MSPSIQPRGTLVTRNVVDAGKMAQYVLRWSMRDGTTLTQGETVSATITG